MTVTSWSPETELALIAATQTYTTAADGLDLPIDAEYIADGRRYKRIAAAPGYEDMGDGAAPVTTDKLAEVMVVAHNFRKHSDPDDTLSIQRALATGWPVRLAGGMGTGPNGEYYVDQNDPTGATSLIQRNGIVLIGDGKDRTIVRPKQASGYALHASKNNSDPALNYRGLRISDIAFQGWVVEEGFQEHTHLLSLSCVSDCVIERCAFVAWRGDALYVGQGNGSGHNERFTIRDCYFDGVNNNQRNGISLIDCDTFTIENNSFLRCSRPGTPGYVSGAYDVMSSIAGPGMPGAIDCEPNGGNAKIVNGIIRGNHFSGCSGNVGTIGIQIPNTVPKGNVRGILIEGNAFRQNFVRGFEIHCHIVHVLADPVSADEPGNMLVVRDNHGWDGAASQGCISLFCVKDALVEGNSFSDYGGGCLFGYVADSRSMKVMNVTVARNRFTRCASQAGSRLLFRIFDADGLIFDGNIMDDCGDGSVFAYIWDFNAGTSRGVEILNNIVTSATGKTSNNAIIKEAAHTFTASTNRQLGNTFGNRNSYFAASISDIAQQYTPIVEGGTTAGAGTYTAQYGEYTQNNGWVQGYARLGLTGHTGVGVIEIAVPVNPINLAGPDYPVEIVMATTGAGAPGANKQICAQVHGFASTAAGEGAIRVSTMDLTTGVLAPLNIADVAYTIFVRFAYRAQVSA